ncbi:MAG: DUF4440 domain-containing protein [Candidatus Geothermincolia bacterium]
MSDNDMKQALIELEERRRDAWLDRDRQALADLMADDFMEVNYFGRLSRDEVLDDLFPDLTLVNFNMEGFEYAQADPDVAILTYRCFEKISYQGSEVNGDFHVAATYARREGRWQLLLWQITPYNG